jgi:predicted ATPase/DNA-binding SARP family transcriptional activator
MLLKIYLLGQFKLQNNDYPIELPSRPAQSLLAFLVLNAGMAHRREKLASLIWPESTESNARGYLRQALWLIRKALKSASLNWENYLQISNISVSFDDQSEYWLDADLLFKAVEARPVEEIIKIIRIFRGELLPGFYDEWIVLERDRLQAAYHQKMNLLLELLIQAEQWDDAVKWSEQWILLGYSPEPAFRALMRAYAGLGDQGLVSATYHRCVESLKRELSLEPSPETKKLYEQILCGELDAFISPPTHTADPVAQPPSFIDLGVSDQIEKPIFVAREREITQLENLLKLALSGQGRVIFITGEAGSGKTALVNEFNQRAQHAHKDLLVVSGNCNAHTGIGDPYLPFREIMNLLTGDVEARWVAGAISSARAQLLWNTLPIAAQAVVEIGPDLIDTFVLGTALVDRAAAATPGGADWLTRLDELVERKATGNILPNRQQHDLFEQYTRVLKTLARKAPLVLVVDDLQWADLGSINLLFHLGRNLSGSNILILGVYRSEEVALGRDGERHPLEPVISEIHRQFGDMAVNMDQAESRNFLEQLLDGEPNKLGVQFREMVYQLTRGQPLFTVELLRGMQERGNLVQDEGGHWVEGSELDWETLPVRVEAVVAERIGRLTEPLQAALRVASVEGETFTAEVVARVQVTDEGELLRHFSGDLDRKHRLIRAQSIQRINGQLISCYRFRHILFQRFLYNNLDEIERVHLHEQVGTTLERLYRAQEEKAAAADIAPQLARHFQEAGIAEKAIRYLHKAGKKALNMCAYKEAIEHLTRGISLLKTLPDSPERAQQEFVLQLAFGMACVGPKGYGREVEEAYARAHDLCQQIGKGSQLCQVLGELAVIHYVHAEYQRARELAVETLNLSQQIEDPMLIMISHWHLGFILFALGEFSQSRVHLQQVISNYEPQKHHHALVSLRGSDAGVSALAYDACCLWCLGYPDQAARRSQQALALARELDHPFTLADVLGFGGGLFNVMRRDAQALHENTQELKRLASDKLLGWLRSATSQQGQALVKLGNIEDGIAQMRSLLALAEAEGMAGHPEDALITLAEGFSVVERTGERYAESELYRIQADLLLKQGDEVEAEASLKKAIEVAHLQNAMSWKLRAVIDLAKLYRGQGRLKVVGKELKEIYSWFSEGFDTPDLIQAKILLEEIS